MEVTILTPKAIKDNFTHFEMFLSEKRKITPKERKDDVLIFWACVKTDNISSQISFQFCWMDEYSLMLVQFGMYLESKRVNL